MTAEHVEPFTAIDRFNSDQHGMSERDLAHHAGVLEDIIGELQDLAKRATDEAAKLRQRFPIDHGANQLLELAGGIADILGDASMVTLAKAVEEAYSRLVEREEG